MASTDLRKVLAPRIALLSLASLALASCDSAGSVLDDTARLAAVEQCRQVSEGAGIAGPAVTKVCNCAADKWLDKPVAQRVDISPDAIRAIINECAGTDRATASSGTAQDADGSY